MEDIISQTKAELLRSKKRMAQALATTPDDKLQWSPSPTARTPLQQVAHGASGIANTQGMLTGMPFPYPSIGEYDKAARTDEQQFTTRDQVLSLLEQSCTDYFTLLDTLTPEQLASTVQLPFGTSFPMAVCITFAASHLNDHAAQMDYIQTIYGDHDWHMGHENEKQRPQ